MAHARLTQHAMFDWIEQRLGAGQPAPTDPEICDRFGFVSTESARTLLADLADARRIIIHGYGPARRLELARDQRPASGRSAPADPVLDRGLAKIAAILARGAKRTEPIEAAAKIDPEPPLPAADAGPVHQREEEDVPTPSPTPTSRTISVPAKGVVLAAIEARANDRDIALGQAAVTLVEDALNGAAGPAQVPVFDLDTLPTSDLIEELGHRLTTGSPELVAAAVARAEAAEGQLSTMKAQLALLLGEPS